MKKLLLVKKHGCEIYHAKVKISGSEQIIEICPECEKEEILKMESLLRQEAKIQALLSHTYKVFERESIYSQELSDKTLENYTADNPTSEQKPQLYGKRMLRDYLKFEEKECDSKWTAWHWEKPSFYWISKSIE